MPIPEAQLETWSHQGSITQSSNTYNSVKGVLAAAGTAYAGKSYEVFLQGSYGNDTNVYAESDVDVVICLNDCFSSDLRALTDAEKQAYHAAFPNATYGHAEFRRDVFLALKEAFGNDVREGGKAFAIAANGSRRKSDVIAAVQYRRYHKFNSVADQTFDTGICFHNTSGTLIANFPRQHSANMTRKHQATSSRLKPVVRVLKNLRSRLIENGVLAVGGAPSYYLEGLVYNVPSEHFAASLQGSFVNAMTWLQSCEKAKLVCANEQFYLVRDNDPGSWPTADCLAFIQAGVKLWNDW